MSRGHVLVLAATPGELAGLARLVGRTHEYTVGGRRGWGGEFQGRSFRALCTGPGQVNTAQALSAALEAERPGLIVQTGCAGAYVGSGLGVGDLGLAAEEIDPYLGLESGPGERLPLAELPFPVLVHQGRELTNRFPLDQGLAQAAKQVLQAAPPLAGVRVAIGPFVTVATITATDETAAQIESLYRPVMENMEGAASALVAWHYDRPLIEVRAAANLVGRRERDKWDLGLAAERAGLAVAALIAAAGRGQLPL